MRLILFPPQAETEKNVFMNVLCFCFGNLDNEQKINKRTGLKHTRILGNVYTMNTLKSRRIEHSLCLALSSLLVLGFNAPF